MTQYWVIRGGERRGPYEESDVLEGVELGTVRPNDLLWVEGMREGVPITEVISNLGAAPPSKPPLTLEPLAPGVRGAASPYRPPSARVDDLAELALGNITYAGFWVRFGAALLDNLIVGVFVVLALVIGSQLAGAAAPGGRAMAEPRRVLRRVALLRDARIRAALRGLRQARVPPPGARRRRSHPHRVPAREPALGRAIPVVGLCCSAI